MSLPSSLALTPLVNSTLADATDVDASFTAIQTAVNGLITYLAALPAASALAGCVNADGTIPSGFTGYSVVAHGSGSYDVTFSPAFGSVPAVVAEQVTVGTTLAVSSVTASTFHVQTQGGANGAFSFFAQAHP